MRNSKTVANSIQPDSRLLMLGKWSGTGIGSVNMEWYQNSGLIFAITIENLMLLVAAMGCFLVYVKKNRTRKSNEEYELLDMLNRYYSQSANNVKKSYDQINMLKHDIRNILLVVMNLISQNQLEKAQKLLGEKLHQIDRIYKLVDTDNEYANAILNQKLSEARAADMEIHCAILTSFGGIGNQDICSLFGNLLDNAIEANVGNSDHPWLDVLVEGEQDKIEIICRNSIYKSLKLHDNRLPLTGKDRREHGYGSRIVREIAEKYGGEVLYRVGEKELEVVVHLMRSLACGE